jgi:hypothetical protein
MERIEKDNDGNAWSIMVRPNKSAGGYLVTMKRNGTVFMKPISVKEKSEIHGAIAELLRWVDKLGFDLPMADASRSRSYMK